MIVYVWVSTEETPEICLSFDRNSPSGEYAEVSHSANVDAAIEMMTCDIKTMLC